MKLSILIPSKYPEKLEDLLLSLDINTRRRDDIEIVTLIDDSSNYINHRNIFGFEVVEIHRKSNGYGAVNMSVLNFECLKYASGEWIMLGNDDCLVETMNWDDQIREAMERFKDNLSLIYPNDGMFREYLSCFPIISKKLIGLVNLFPMPYNRYKIDDTIFYLVPRARHIYLKDCKFTHLNKSDVAIGYKLPDGSFYKTDEIAAEKDNQLWEYEKGRRAKMSDILNKELGIAEKKVLIGVITGEYARRADFYDYYNMLEKPVNSIALFCHDRSPAKGRNIIIEQALEHNCSHVLLIDDDMAYKSNALNQLLEHDVDIVSGLYLMRGYPHQPLIFGEADENGACTHAYLFGDEPRLKEVVAAGLGFCLINMNIFKALKKPWIRLGELNNEEWCDDLGFFNRVRKAGFKIFCDTECRLGHMGTMIVWPNKAVNGQWLTGYDTNGKDMLNTPQRYPEMEKA